MIGTTATPTVERTINRRDMLVWASAMSASLSLASTATAQARQRPEPSDSNRQQPAPNPLRKGMMGFMLAHEQFTVPELVEIGKAAAHAGFDLLATSDHFQPWQANEGHSGEAWVTLAALGSQAGNAWMGTTVTCPILRYNPAVVAEGFASLSHLYPGRIFLGVGSGEALNEQAATGEWPKWQERWDRLIEAMTIVRELWTGKPVSYKGKYYSVAGRLYDPPSQPIPLLTAANAKKSMRLAGRHGDGLITDPATWKEHKSEWEAGARAAGKNPADMPVLIEHYAVVGGEDEVREAAELWRFGPKAFKGYESIPDPSRIQQRADSEIPLEKVYSSWATGTDPAQHIRKAKELFDSGATIVNIHSGQRDQKKVIDFYASEVLPQVRA
jgi:TAT-translocated FGD2 family F420-dependent dehydrogenase